MLDIVKIGVGLLDKVIPDPEQREKAKLELLKQAQGGQLKDIEAAKEIVISETQGESWLQRNWRPRDHAHLRCLGCC